MTNTKICQSCAMPMTAADHGTNADGTPSTDFCKFCMKNGKMGDCTMEQMADICADIDLRDGRAADKQAAVNMYMSVLPMLKRWGGTGTMEYEVVELPQMTVRGLGCRTSNTAPDMSEKIGGLWKSFFGGVFQSIDKKASPYTYGVYSNYATDFTGEYDMTVGCQVTEDSVSDNTVTTVIPSGKYAKFTLHGDAQKDIYAFWCRLWFMPLERAYTADFEEYVSEHDFNIYISIK
ncbi:MAG: effector binding domain-containing protein [Oscillospiraceae bacterium]|nr:effector binding domain-containing protein [Ruminococcus sp.]